MEDIDIARQAKLQNITKVAEKLGIEEDYLEQYGKYKAKISNKLYEKLKDKKDGKLILVTSINPTPLGEPVSTILSTSHKVSGQRITRRYWFLMNQCGMDAK